MSHYSLQQYEVFGQRLAVRVPDAPGTWQDQLPMLLADYFIGQFQEESTLSQFDIIGVEYVQDTLPWHVTYDKYTHMLADETQVLAHLEWRIFTVAIWYASAAIGLHAGAVSSVHGAMVLPGASGRGKTTLTLALTTHGWDYLTDDVCLIEQQAGGLVPLPCRRCCHLDTQSTNLLAALGLTLHQPVATLPEYFLPPKSSTDAPPLRWVVIPQFEPAAQLSLIRLTQAETAAALLDAGLRQVNRTLREQRATAIAVAIQTMGYRLIFPDLAQGMAMLDELANGTVV